jgi:hypothetical protein
MIPIPLFWEVITMTENIEAAKRELTKQILDDLGITLFLKGEYMTSQPQADTRNPDTVIEKYSEYFKKLYTVINAPTAP